MKNAFLIFAVTGIVLLASCNNEPSPEPEPEPKPHEEQPFPVGTWHTKHQYYSVTKTYPPNQPVDEVSAEVATEDAYILVFNSDGSGSGSAIKPDSAGERYYFKFTWILSDSCIIFNSDYVVLPTHLITCMDWVLEEHSSEDMVLSTSGWFQADKPDIGTDIGYGYEGVYLFRYTLKKVK
jgi:hypothetical protein